MQAHVIFVFAVILCASLARGQSVSDRIGSGLLELSSGGLVRTGSVVDVDSCLRDSDACNGFFADPFGTLAGCCLFACKGTAQGSKNAVGVFKGNQIIWISDTIIAGFNGRFLGARDLENDGKVEILTAWVDGFNGSWEYLWIIRWNGAQGEIVNAHRGGHSLLVAYPESFVVADVDGDGNQEIVGDKVGMNEDGELVFEQKVAFRWDGNLYTDWPSSPVLSRQSSTPANHLSAAVRAVTKGHRAQLRFDYFTWNDVGSMQSVKYLYLAFEAANTTGHAPEGWKYYTMKAVPLVYFEAGSDAVVIRPGGQMSGFTVTAGGSLPAISHAYLQAAHMVPDMTVEEIRSDFLHSIQDIYSNSFAAPTIVPVRPIDSLEHSSFLDTLLSYTRQSADLGWLGRDRDNDCDDDERPDDGVTKNIEKRLEKAKRYLERDDSLKARRELEKLVQKVERIWKRSQDQDKKRGRGKEWKQDTSIMTSEAYALLKYNTKYLIDHLSDKQPKRGKTRERE